MDAGSQENLEVSSFLDDPKLRTIYGHKRNHAGGEQVHFSKHFNDSKWACEFWVAGFANRENHLIFGALKISRDFFGTRWRFWL